MGVMLRSVINSVCEPQEATGAVDQIRPPDTPLEAKIALRPVLIIIIKR